MILIFDVDDTLVYTHKKAYEKTVCIANILGYSLQFEKFKKVYGKMDFDSCLLFWFENIDVLQFKKEYNLIRENYPYQPVGNVYSLLNDLSKQSDIGIITNSSKEGVFFKLKCMGLKEKQNIFKFIYHRENVLRPKPNSEQIELICQKGYSKKEIYYFGDSIQDYEFAKNSKIKFYAVLTGLTTKDDFIKNGLGKNQILDNVQKVRELFYNKTLKII